MSRIEEATLELKGVSKIYQISQGLFGKPKPWRALDDVNIQLRKGEVLGQRV